MTTVRLGAVAFAAAILSVSSAWAHTITYRFTGSVTNIDFSEQPPPFDIPDLGLETSFEGTITYDLNAPGTPFAGDEGGITGIAYSAPVPPSRMTVTLQGVTIESNSGSALQMAVYNPLLSNLTDTMVDAVSFLADVPGFTRAQLVVRLEDTTESTFATPALPAWIALSRFDLRSFEIWQYLPGGVTRRYLTGTIRTFEPVARNVAIDVAPGRYPNRINAAVQAHIPVALLTLPRAASDIPFDATAVDPASVRFGAFGFEAEPVKQERKDVNGDGNKDVLFYFRTEETGMDCSTRSASLSAFTKSGIALQGTDSVRPIQCSIVPELKTLTAPSRSAPGHRLGAERTSGRACRMPHLRRHRTHGAGAGLISVATFPGAHPCGCARICRSHRRCWRQIGA